MRLGAVQLPGSGIDLRRNRDVALAAIHDAAAQGVELVVLPELCTTPYFCAGAPEEFRQWSVEISGELVAAFRAACRDLSVAAVVPFYERTAIGTFHNSAAVIGRDGELIVGRGFHGEVRLARKMHLPMTQDGGVITDETAHFSPAEDLGVFDLGTMRLGCLICYDRRFPECWRAMRALGADVVAVPVAGEGGDDAAFFIGELRTHAKENGVGIVCANKVGPESISGVGINNDGESCIISGDGTVLAHRAAAEGPGLVMAMLDTGMIEAARARIPFFEQRSGRLRFA
jgi:predicted amidohydrolase